MAIARRVLIVGDEIADRRLYLRDSLPLDNGQGEAQLVEEPGGARLLFDLVKEASTGDVRLGVTHPTAPAAAAVRHSLWRCLPGAQGSAQWRCTEPVGLEGAGSLQDLETKGSFPDGAEVTLVKDMALSLRSDANASCWPDVTSGQFVFEPPTPDDLGPLWPHLVNGAADRLTLVLEAQGLRAMSVHLTLGISWERTALDLIREVRNNPVLSELRRPRNLIVRFDLEGALHLVLENERIVDARIVYEAAGREGAERKRSSGGVLGLADAFAAGLALHLDADGTPGSVMAGMQTGLAAGRALNRTGHGPADETPAPPMQEMVEALRGDQPALAVATVPHDLDDVQAQTWTILNSRAVGVACGSPLYGLAHRLAAEGLDALWDVPREAVGSYVTVDRSEIEALRALEQMIEVYLAHDSGKAPLSIGVFGPSGAGKSFAVKQIGAQLLRGKPLEFNLSQFGGPQDLIGALHQVRDAVLAGRTPLVFFDEFDSKGYDWLQYLLAPMQDGRFQDGQLNHPVGKCVFIFAGGTSPTFERFGQFEGLDGERAEKRERFRLVKGPDFKSRLSGHLNVLGPNPRLDYTQGVEKAPVDPLDIAFPLRRALMLRGLLGAGTHDRLDIDTGLLAGLMEVGLYRHGSRSLQKTAYYLEKCGARGSYRRSDLPAPAILAPHVDGAELLRLASESGHVARTSRVLAAAIHSYYDQAVSGARYTGPFDDLPLQIRADNFAAAERIACMLRTVDLDIVGSDDPRALPDEELQGCLEQDLEDLARAEHDGWREFKACCGWRRGPRAKDEALELLQLQHDRMAPYDELPPNEQEKDRRSVRDYVKVLRSGGLAVARASRS